MGHGIGKVAVAGLTGAAFTIGWNADHLLSGMGGAVFQFAHEGESATCRFDLLAKEAQVHHDLLKRGNPGLYPAVREALDRGRPVPVLEWDPVDRRGHAALVFGYEEPGEKLLARVFDFARTEEPAILKPENLQFALILEPDSSGDRKDRRATRVASLVSAANLLQGGTYRDEETWQLGTGCYVRQAALLEAGMDPDRDRHYALKEHFLFWRLEILLLCRMYATAYLDELSGDPLLSDLWPQLRAIEQDYRNFCTFFEKHLRIQADFDSIVNGSPLIWTGNGGEQPIRSLFSSPAGKRAFSGFLMELNGMEQEIQHRLAAIARFCGKGLRIPV